MALTLDLFLASPLVAIGLALSLMAIKTAILWVLALLFRRGSRLSLAVALLLAQSGEFALVLFAVAFESGLLESDLFQRLLMVVITSMLMTPPLARLANRLAVSAKRGTTSNGSGASEPEAVPVLIAGFGRVGRRIGQILEMRGIGYHAVDNDATLVQHERRAGRAVPPRILRLLR